MSANRYRRGDDLVVEEFDDAIVILNPRTIALHRLDPPAAAVWTILDRPTGVEDLVDAICQHFEGDRASIHADVAGLLDELCGTGLLIREGLH